MYYSLNLSFVIVYWVKISDQAAVALYTNNSPISVNTFIYPYLTCAVWSPSLVSISAAIWLFGTALIGSVGFDIRKVVASA